MINYGSSKVACLKESHGLPWESPTFITAELLVEQPGAVVEFAMEEHDSLTLGQFPHMGCNFQNNLCQRSIFIFSKRRMSVLIWPRNC